ncbi:hypothetical protein LCGC14_0323020 [marine sediment metagenome]|uniref:Uncharacterized protein n=1 Tax=marine sediment metagenome TaxID=412755 RepID=A0A0F9WQR4_9ZZZZ
MSEPGCTVCTHHIKPMKLSTCNSCNPSGRCSCTICGLQAENAALLAACEDADIWFDQNMACETSASFQRLRHKFTAAIAKAKEAER